MIPISLFTRSEGEGREEGGGGGEEASDWSRRSVTWNK